MHRSVPGVPRLHIRKVSTVPDRTLPAVSVRLASSIEKHRGTLVERRASHVAVGLCSTAPGFSWLPCAALLAPDPGRRGGEIKNRERMVDR